MPSVQWVAAFAEGSRSGADPANDTTGSGVFVEIVPETGYTLCGGRTVPIRRRERQEIALLVMVASRFMDALAGRVVAPADDGVIGLHGECARHCKKLTVHGPPPNVQACCASVLSGRVSLPGPMA